MFLGHWGVGLGAKRAAPELSLGTLFLAAQWVDLAWPTLLLAGIETVRIVPGATRVTPLEFASYPVTHSLSMGILWAVALGGIVFLARRTLRGAVVVALAVVSHWFLDLVVHAPDLPLVPSGGPRLGLGLWSSLPATLVVEAALLGGGALVYTRATRPLDRRGSLGFAALLAVLAAIYLASVFGPPPPSVAAIAWAGHLQWLFVAWGYWLDRHRPAHGRRDSPGGDDASPRQNRGFR
jgi:hypothetical protein